MSAIDQMKGQQANEGSSLAIATVGSKLKPILRQRAMEVAKTIADFNAAEDEFIAKKLGASNLKAVESTLDVGELFETL